MASGDEHLFVCFVLGSDGSLVSLAAVVPELIVALERAVLAGDMQTGRTIHGKLYELAKRVYAVPGHLATLRLKTCLLLMGRLSSVASRAPITALSEKEQQTLHDALVKAAHRLPLFRTRIHQRSDVLPADFRDRGSLSGFGWS